jgi:hypothetical protein
LEVTPRDLDTGDSTQTEVPRTIVTVPSTDFETPAPDVTPRRKSESTRSVVTPGKRSSGGSSSRGVHSPRESVVFSETSSVEDSHCTEDESKNSTRIAGSGGSGGSGSGSPGGSSGAHGILVRSKEEKKLRRHRPLPSSDESLSVESSTTESEMSMDSPRYRGGHHSGFSAFAGYSPRLRKTLLAERNWVSDSGITSLQSLVDYVGTPKNREMYKVF